MEALESKTYTTEKTLAEQMNERLRELKMTKAEAAMRMNYSRPALSQYLNGKYASDPTEIEKKITEFLLASGGMEGVSETSETTEGTGLKLKSKVEFFESRDFINTIGVCQACQENIGLGIIVGKSGQGKTHALKKYAKLQRVAYIECDDTMACRDLVEAIEMELGMPRSAGGTIWSRVNRMEEKGDGDTGKGGDAPAEVVANSTILKLLELDENAKTEDVAASIMALKAGGDKVTAATVLALKEKIERKEADEAVQLALKEGKITAAQTEWAKEYALKDADGFKKFMEKAVAVVPQGKMALKDTPADNTKTDDVDMAILKNCGISKEDMEKYYKKED